MAMAQTPFEFLKLPAEIRNQIYELLLTRPNHKPCLVGSGLRVSQPLGLAPVLLGLCRQIYYECRELLYSGWFTAHPSLLTSLPFKFDPYRPITSQSHTSWIRKYYIEVRLDVDPRWTAEDLCKAFTGVDELWVFAWQPSFGLVGPEVLERFKTVRRVGKARVYGNGVSSEFSEWLQSIMESDDSYDQEISKLNQPALNIWDHSNR